MAKQVAVLLLAILVGLPGMAQSKNYLKAKVSFEDFKELVTEVESHRAKRLIDLNTFLQMSQDQSLWVWLSRGL